MRNVKSTNIKKKTQTSSSENFPNSNSISPNVRLGGVVSAFQDFGCTPGRRENKKKKKKTNRNLQLHSLLDSNTVLVLLQDIQQGPSVHKFSDQIFASFLIFERSQKLLNQ
jgi:hypothetical protein